MGKWLNQLREIAKTPGDRTDKTDKTAPAKVLSVLSARSDGISKIFTPDRTVGSVSFVASPSDPSQDFRAFNNHGWDEEDWQSAFDERAAILEFDEGMSREEAELLAGRQLEAERNRWLQ
jgi:hypothetical protein